MIPEKAFSLDLLINKLDDFFKIDTISPDLPFSRNLEKKYLGTGINLSLYVVPQFLVKCHGIMIRNGNSVNKVYSSVFLSEEILDKLLVKGEKDLLLFVHHPMDMETGGRGFFPLRKSYFDKMKTSRISVYALHSPLDINENISTSKSIANALGVINTGRYDQYLGGFAGVYGELPVPVKFDDFILTLKKIFNIVDIRFLKNRNDVKKIGIIAGGGAEIEYIKETMALGCDTYLTGEFENRVQNDYSRKLRDDYEKYKINININLIATSHNASEKLVMEIEMQNFFKTIGVNTEFLDSEDYWK